MIHYLLVYYVTVYGMPADSYLLRENDRRLEMSEITNEIKKRRTFAIISHPDAGKTTLTEKFLLYGGAINQAGSVKGKATSKHAVSDWMEIETLMATKGFSEAVVSLGEDSADVVVNAEELTDANRAQIVDIVTRKSDVKPEKIVIIPIHE